MKFDITYEQLSKITSKLKNLIKTNTLTMPVLNCIKITVKNNKATFLTTNLTTVLCFYEDVVNAIDGTCLIDAAFLANITKLKETNLIKFNIKDNNCDIQYGKTKYKVMTINPEDYPTIPEYPKPENTFNVSEQFKTCLSHTKYAIAIDPHRVVLNGTYVEFKDNTVTIATTNGHMLSKATYEQKDIFNASSIIPIDAISGILAFDNAYMYQTEKTIVCYNEQSELSSQVIQGTYPDINKVILDNYLINLELNRNNIVEVLKRIKVLADNKNTVTHLTLKDNKMIFNLVNSDIGDVKDEIEIEYTDKEITIGLNIFYLSDVLNNCGDMFMLKIKDTTGPVRFDTVINDVTLLHILMPIRIS